MANFKLTISDVKGKSITKELKEGDANPLVGLIIGNETDAAIVESVKAASDVYSPISGEVTEVNPMLEDQPEIINSSPYEDGWFYKMIPSDLGEIENLLSPEDYGEVCED